MTRYFYPGNRAHHAYCMAVDFGMTFKKRNGVWLTESLPSIVGPDYRIEVAEESLHLLDPQVGDMLTNIGAIGWRLLESRGDILMFHDGRNEVFGRREEMQIIQRNGLPFHQPDFEP